MTQSESLKRAAAARALDLVRPGMKLGLGTGSTAKHFVELLGERVAAGLEVVGVPTSEQTARLARALGVPLSTLDELAELDLTVDGADEIDPDLRLIKGGGAALLREKIVASASKRMVVIADQSKQVPALGRYPLPIEVVPFGRPATERAVRCVLAEHGLPQEIALRLDGAGAPLLTDGGHHILDARLGRIAAPDRLADSLDRVVGVVEHGLFIGLASAAFIATPDGVETMGDAA